MVISCRIMEASSQTEQSAMSQHHPPDARGKLLRRFYEPLILLSVLDPTRGAQRPDLTSESGLDGWSKLWRSFLDQLSMLCDARKGGDTVTAIAVQSTPEHPVYWLASNSKLKDDAQKLLTWTLTCLATVHALDTTEEARVQDEIEARSIDFNFLRIKTYTGWLLKSIDKARRLMEGSTKPEVLMHELQRIKNLATSPRQLCAFAYALRRHEMMNILHSRHLVHVQRGIWSNLRHYIGRLGSWSKAARILILGAKKFPQYIENAQVRIVEPYGPVDLLNKNHVTNLKGVVGRMLHSHQATIATGLIQALEDLDTLIGIESAFLTRYAEVRPRPHAELILLEYFYHHLDLDFAAGDRYIGCSKPSCYCCHIYMLCHPGNFTPRPCHGNLWPNWAPPIPLSFCDYRGAQQGGHTRIQDHHTFEMLQMMVTHVRRDLQDQIHSRQPRRQTLPDSTTGISSLLFGRDQAESDALLRAQESPEPLETIYSEVDAGHEVETASTDFVDADMEAFGIVRDGNNHSDNDGDGDDGDGDDGDEEDEEDAEHDQVEEDEDNGNDENDEDDDDTGYLLFKGRRK